MIVAINTLNIFEKPEIFLYFQEDSFISRKISINDYSQII